MESFLFGSPETNDDVGPALVSSFYTWEVCTEAAFRHKQVLRMLTPPFLQQNPALPHLTTASWSTFTCFLLLGMRSQLCAVKKGSLSADMEMVTARPLRAIRNDKDRNLYRLVSGADCLPFHLSAEGTPRDGASAHFALQELRYHLEQPPSDDIVYEDPEPGFE